ncbi:MAG: aldolase/citrate lyase family protein [Terriglobia bacterium]|jgi:4-hydroxy-2-oxoheptanedioate aldolase
MGTLIQDARNDSFPRSTILGLWQQFPIPMVSYYLAQMRWDCVILDMQHGCLNLETAYDCIHVIRAAGVQPWVRVSISSPNEVQKMLDLGALGIIVPMVNSVKEAQELASAAKYPPLGSRSLGGDFRYTYGDRYPEEANAATKLLVQVEHIRSIEVVEELVAVEGVDGCFIGPTDLALSMGLPRSGFESDLKHRLAIQRTLDACACFNKLSCCNCYSVDEAKEKANQGFQCLTLQSDADHFVAAVKKLLAELRAATRSQPVAAFTRPTEMISELPSEKRS